LSRALPVLEQARRWLCRLLEKAVHWACPEFTPAHESLPPGAVADAVEIEDGRFERLARAAVAPAEEARSMVWREADAEVVVHLDRTRVRARDGLVLIGLTLECDQTGVAEVVVPFAVGTDERAAGMVAATERKPRGPEVLVTRWGDAIIATAWRALVETADSIARERGSDLEGEPLRTGALSARSGQITVVPQARHVFERASVR
jgi:hypothetical protein